MGKKAKWNQLAGMTENQAEAHMLANWGGIPKEWNKMEFRREVLGEGGAIELTAHLNNFENAYGGDSRLGDEAKGVGFRRNVEGQGLDTDTNAYVAGEKKH